MDDALAIVLFTYKRAAYAEMTLRSILENIRFSGPISVIIADDGSPAPHAEVLQDIAGGYSNVRTTGKTNAERGGYGRSFNLASQNTHSFAKYVLPLEDDWVCQRELNVDHFIPALTSGVIGCVRLGYMGFTQELRGKVVVYGDEHYLLFDPASPEVHVLAGHPRLETVEWQRSVGPWPEGLAPGVTEMAVCNIPAARQHVAWPLDYVRPRGDLFGHVGTVRSTDVD